MSSLQLPRFTSSRHIAVGGGDGHPTAPGRLGRHGRRGVAGRHPAALVRWCGILVETSPGAEERSSVQLRVWWRGELQRMEQSIARIAGIRWEVAVVVFLWRLINLRMSVDSQRFAVISTWCLDPIGTSCWTCWPFRFFASACHRADLGVTIPSKSWYATWPWCSLMSWGFCVFSCYTCQKEELQKIGCQTRHVLVVYVAVICSEAK